jgi:hypothetical protein
MNSERSCTLISVKVLILPSGKSLLDMWPAVSSNSCHLALTFIVSCSLSSHGTSLFATKGPGTMDSSTDMFGKPDTM